MIIMKIVALGTSFLKLNLLVLMFVFRFYFSESLQFILNLYTKLIY